LAQKKEQAYIEQRWEYLIKRGAHGIKKAFCSQPQQLEKAKQQLETLKRHILIYRKITPPHGPAILSQLYPMDNKFSPTEGNPSMRRSRFFAGQEMKQAIVELEQLYGNFF
jgi:hypothetical protein